MNEKSMVILGAMLVLGLVSIGTTQEPSEPRITGAYSINDKIDLTIINIRSYPSLYGNWTVRFNTTGTVNLTIRALNGTEFGRDIEFLELRCGDNILTTELADGAVFVENYSCDEIGYEISKVLIAGKHTLEFRFGDDVEYAYNSPSDITFVDSAEAIVNGGTSLTINVPAGVQDGDLMVAVIGHAESEDNTYNPPSGWSEEVAETQVGQTPPSIPGVVVYWRVASSEPASYTWTASFSSGLVGHILAYRDVDTSGNPIGQKATAQSSTTGCPTAPSVTTANDKEMVLYIGFMDGDEVPATEANFYPASTTGREAEETATGGNGMGLGTADELRASAGATGTRAFQNCQAADEWAAITISLLPVLDSDGPNITNAAFNETAVDLNEVVQFNVTVTDDTAVDMVKATFRYPNATEVNKTLIQYNESVTDNSTGQEGSTISKYVTAPAAEYIVNGDFSSGSGSDAYNWTRSHSGNGQTVWDSTNLNMHTYATTANDVGDGYVDQNWTYDGPIPPESATLNFSWYLDLQSSSDPNHFYVKLTLPNGTEYTVWSDTGNTVDVPWTPESVDILSYIDSTGNYTLRLHARIDTDSGGGSEAHARWDNVSLEVYAASLNDSSTAYTAYEDVTPTTYDNVTNITVTVQVDTYNPEASVNQSTDDPDLQLDIYNGSSNIPIGNFSLNTSYTGDTLDISDYNFSLSTTDSTILDAWETVSNRDIRIRGVKMDYTNSTTIDEINYTGVWVSVDYGNATDVYYYDWTDTSTTGTYNVTYVWANDTYGNANSSTYTDVSFEVTSADVPVVGTPETYDNATLAAKTTFERNDGMTTRVNVTDPQGEADIDTVLITILNTTSGVKINNETMVSISSITNGSTYEYNYTIPSDAEDGTWTINVYANDTSNNRSSNTATFDVVVPPTITIDSPLNDTIPDTTPDLNFTVDETANVTYSWDGEGNITGCRECTSYNTTYGENNGSDANLVALYHLNENFSSTTYDDSGNSNDGTLGNATAGTDPTWTMGKFGPALEFDGNDFVNVSDSPSLDFTENLTMAAWVYPKSWPGPTYSYVVGKTEAYTLGVNISAGDALYTSLYNGTAWTSHYSSTATLPLNQWSHIASTFNGSYVRLYLNGTEVYSAAVPAAWGNSIATNDYSLTVALYTNPTGSWQRYFNGTIDEVAIYNRSLSGAEVQEMYNRTLSEGQHYVTVYATDTVGNQNSTTRWFRIDTAPLIISNPQFNKTTDVAQNEVVRFNVTVSDATGVDTVKATFRYPNATEVNKTLIQYNESVTDNSTDRESGTISKYSVAGEASAMDETADGGQLTGSYNYNGGSYTDTQTDNNVNYWVGHTSANTVAWAELIYDITGLGITASQITKLNFNVGYCHSGDDSGTPACNGVEGTPQDTQDVEIYNFTSSSWVDIGDLSNDDASSETSDNWDITSGFSDYVNSTDELRLRVEANYANSQSMGGEDSSLLVDYAFLDVYYTAPANETNTSYTDYANVTSTTYDNVTNVTVTVQVTSYNPEASVNQSTDDPDLQLDIYNGSANITIGNFSLNTSYTGDTLNITDANFSLSTTDSTILDAWETASNRDIRVRGVKMDYYDSTTIDEINYTGVWVTVNYENATDIYYYDWTDTPDTGTYNVTYVWANDTYGNANATTYTDVSFEVAGDVIDVTLYDVPIQFSSTDPGEGSVYANVGYGYPMNVTIESTTNVAINLTLKGDANFTTGAYNFSVGNLSYHNESSGTYTDMTASYPSTPPYADWIDIPAPAADTNRSVYFAISIPLGQEAGTYSATVTVKVEKT